LTIAGNSLHALPFAAVVVLGLPPGGGHCEKNKGKRAPWLSRSEAAKGNEDTMAAPVIVMTPLDGLDTCFSCDG